MQLTQAGWTIIRFKDTEIEKKGQQVIGTILKNVSQKEVMMKKFLGGDKGDGKKQNAES
jgi:very-short-patch-repair endonuclease